MVSPSQPIQPPPSIEKIEKKAIDHALAGEWEQAVGANIEGIEIYPGNVGCHNRLAKAYLELSKYKDARASLEKALEIDPRNKVASKQMERLSKLSGNGIVRRTSGGTATSSALFISDPAVATVSELKKIASSETLIAISPGDRFKLNLGDVAATVTTGNGEYVGTLEVRIATRLRKLIGGGNEYEILASRLSDSGVFVVVRETKRSPEQARTASFPSYLQKKIGDFDIDDPMVIDDELVMEDDMDEVVPQPAENDAMKSIMRGEFGAIDEDASLKF